MRAVVLILLPPLVLLAACDGKASTARYRARQAAVDPPKLWSIEVVPAQPGVVSVKLCADSRIQEGLARPAVTAGPVACRPLGKVVVSGGVAIQRCELNGETWVTTASVSGDPARDFVSVQSAEPASGMEGGYSQTRRYRLVGACPEGWDIGDSTNQKGERVKGQSGLLALVGG